jgi:hypothetical protein
MKTRIIISTSDRHPFFMIGLLTAVSSLVLTVVVSSTVSAFDPNATKYEFVKKWGSKGTGNGQFNRVHDIDFNPSETRLYAVTEMVIAYRYLTKMEHFFSNGDQRVQVMDNSQCHIV